MSDYEKARAELLAQLRQFVELYGGGGYDVSTAVKHLIREIEFEESDNDQN